MKGYVREPSSPVRDDAASMLAMLVREIHAKRYKLRIALHWLDVEEEELGCTEIDLERLERGESLPNDELSDDYPHERRRVLRDSIPRRQEHIDDLESEIASLAIEADYCRRVLASPYTAIEL